MPSHIYCLSLPSFEQAYKNHGCKEAGICVKLVKGEVYSVLGHRCSYYRGGTATLEAAVLGPLVCIARLSPVDYRFVTRTEKEHTGVYIPSE